MTLLPTRRLSRAIAGVDHYSDWQVRAGHAALLIVLRRFSACALSAGRHNY